MALKSPTVSVCMPNYNYGRLIDKAIQSVLNQTFEDFELIIVDNCSTDNSVEVIKSFCDPRIRFYQNERNIGYVKNLNRCLSLAKGEYISFLHSDDMYLPRILERSGEVLDSNPEVGLVYCSAKRLDDEGNVTGGFHPFDRDYIIEGEEEFKRLVFGNYIHISAAMVRRECYADVGEFNQELPLHNDWEMWLRICLYYNVAYIAEPLTCYCFHGSNMTDYFLKTNMFFMDGYKTLKMIFSNLPEEKKHLSALESKAIKAWGERTRNTAFQNLSYGKNKLARRNIALAISFDDSLLKDVKTYVSFFSTFLGQRGGKFVSKILFSLFSILRKLSKL